MGEFKYLGVLFVSDERIEWEMDRLIGVSSIMKALLLLISKRVMSKGKTHFPHLSMLQPSPVEMRF